MPRKTFQICFGQIFKGTFLSEISILVVNAEDLSLEVMSSNNHREDQFSYTIHSDQSRDKN